MKEISGYEILDSGNHSKLEKIGPYTLIRASPLSDYPPSKQALWENWDAKYIKNDRGSGSWSYKTKIPESFTLSYAGIKFLTKLTPFGHVGFFPEQVTNWDRVRRIGELTKDLEILNLFAYSGGSTLACLQSGMKVCHLDASKGMVDWARENAKLNQLDDKPVRWIVEDVLKFIGREIKRKKKYQGFILDPPSFGRGSKGEVWKIEEHLGALLDMLMELCDSKPKFVILTCHSQGYSSLALERMLYSRIKIKGTYESSELFLNESSGGKYPAGSCCFFLSK
ncbi:class I SAM-dependent methyltransferase [Leptospira sp. GIMC2001]|uniref:class I SAM-dependent methyltransferase n=1 Tax=Leptospira sp. GIMC2001 TaxID=1513297 RepID=UPI00234B414A|nr:class I SAM-dependent methyltransferase [Leptospira sp. GIMC2001]WCL50514.1 class I SAM-dependent methyltransferase [Leptospira sp. GIMC2001]